MEKKKYTQPYADIELVSKYDVLTLSNDGLKFGDDNNFIPDEYELLGK